MLTLSGSWLFNVTKLSTKPNRLERLDKVTVIVNVDEPNIVVFANGMIKKYQQSGITMKFMNTRTDMNCFDRSSTKIDLENNKVDDEGGKAIGEALKVNTSLTKIYLPYNEIGDEGAKAIEEALQVNASCECIY